jgi:hypothetical protein
MRELARQRLHRIATGYRDAWASLLSGPLEQLLATLVDPSEHATALRQASPFSFALDARTRQRILRETVRRSA